MSWSVIPARASVEDERRPVNAIGSVPEETFEGFDRLFEDEVLRPLLDREARERNEAGMLLLLGVFLRSVLPAVPLLLLQPVLVAGGRGGVGIGEMEEDAIDGARLLPLGRFLPGRLRVVADSATIGGV